MAKIGGLVVMMILTLAVSAQTKLSFCTYVNSANQECVFENTKFISTPDSTHARIYMMLYGPDSFGTSQVFYKIYSIDRFGQEASYKTVTQAVQGSWKTAWQPYSFTSPGKYLIKVYKDTTAEKLILSRNLELFNN
jgi:hypothetical protein